MTPEKYLKHTLSMFHKPSICLLVVSEGEGFETHLHGADGCNPGQVLEMLANAQVMLERQLATAIAAGAEALNKPQEEVAAMYEALVVDLSDNSEHESSAVVEKKKPAPKLLDATGAPLGQRPRLRITE